MQCEVTHPSSHIKLGQGKERGGGHLNRTICKGNFICSQGRDGGYHVKSHFQYLSG